MYFEKSLPGALLYILILLSSFFYLRKGLADSSSGAAYSILF